MVRKIGCECAQRYESQINSNSLFYEVKQFFSEQENLCIFKDIPVKTPYYTGNSKIQIIKWYATKWYKCRVCGCLWEFNYPDFPTQGFVRKFSDGNYRPQ